MSEQTAPGTVPEWDVADRMRKYLEVSDDRRRAGIFSLGHGGTPLKGAA
jgi:hypothetical protein